MTFLSLSNAGPPPFLLCLSIAQENSDACSRVRRSSETGSAFSGSSEVRQKDRSFFRFSFSRFILAFLHVAPCSTARQGETCRYGGGPTLRRRPARLVPGELAKARQVSRGFSSARLEFQTFRFDGVRPVIPDRRNCFGRLTRLPFVLSTIVSVVIY